MVIYNKKIFFNIIIFIYSSIKNIAFAVCKIIIFFAFSISTICYFLLPLKHNMFVIYKLIYIIIKIFKKVNSNYIAISTKPDQKNIIDNCSIYNNQLFLLTIKEKPYTIVTSISRFRHILNIFELLTHYHFIIYFSYSSKLPMWQKKLLNKFYFLQDLAYPNKKNIPVKIVIYASIKNISKNKLLKNNSYYILENTKKNISLFYY